MFKVKEIKMEPQSAPLAPVTNPMPETTQAPSPQPQTPKLPSAFTLFSKSLLAWKINIKTSLLLSLLIFVPITGLIITAFSQAAYHASKYGNHSSAIVNIVSIIIGAASLLLLIYIAVVSIGAFYKVQLDSARGRRIFLKEAFGFGRHYGIRIIALSIVMALVIAIGFVLLIVPGFFMMRRYYLAPFYMVDGDLSIKEAMDASAADSKTFSGAIWGLIGVIFLLAVLGVLPVVGIVASIVSGLYSFAPAVRYTQIQSARGNVAPSAATAVS